MHAGMSSGGIEDFRTWRRHPLAVQQRRALVYATSMVVASVLQVSHVFDPGRITMTCMLVGSEAARAAFAGPAPDVVRMDMHLAGVDGLTLVRELRARPPTFVAEIEAVLAAPRGRHG
jgi:CheY-like chemotaxis protein